VGTAPLRPFRRQWRPYSTANGSEPVTAFLRELPDDDRAAIRQRMATVARVGLQAARHARGEIYEVRCYGKNRLFRVLFSAEGRFGQVYLALVGFVKKTERLPPGMLDLAEERLRDWRARGSARGG
jgi:phage-related protein